MCRFYNFQIKCHIVALSDTKVWHFGTKYWVFYTKCSPPQDVKYFEKFEKFGTPIFYLVLFIDGGGGPKSKNDEKHVKIDENHAKINKLNGFLPQKSRLHSSTAPHGSRLLLRSSLSPLLLCCTFLLNIICSPLWQN